MPVYDTVSEALHALKARGFTHDYNALLETNRPNGLVANPDAFHITEVYRFEGATNPADMAVIYAIEAKTGAEKGVMLEAYGTYSDKCEAIIQRLQLAT